MKKSNNYAPYLYAALVPTISALTHNLLFKSGIILNWTGFSLVTLGLWRLIEWLLSISENLFVKWGSLVLGSSLYALSIIGLDYYVLHLFMPFTGFSPSALAVSLFLMTVVATIIIESVRWTKAREQTKIENLTLQAENIEAQFNLLIQQVNPDFLFHSLTTLQWSSQMTLKQKNTS